MAATASNVSLALNLVQLTVDLHSAVSSKRSTTGLTNVCKGTPGHKHAPAQTNQTLACSSCGNSDKATFSKARKQGNDYVLVDPDVLDEAAELAKAFKGQVDLTYVPAAELEGSTVSVDGSYYVSTKAPQGSAAANTYALIVKWLNENPDIALISKYAVQSAVALYRLQVRNGGLVLTKYAWPSDVHQSPAVPTAETDSGLLTQLDTMIRSQVKTFVLDEWANDSRKVIAEANGQVVQIAAPLTGTAAVLDLAALLAASTAAAKPKRTRRPVAKSA